MVVKDLLINFLFVLIPLFFMQLIYLLNFTKQSRQLPKWVAVLFPAASIILCMLFPATIYEGFIIDFRRIPFVLGILYGSYKLGFFLLGLMLFVRFWIGGDGFYIAVIVFPLLTAALFVLVKRYAHMSFKQKLLVNVVLIPVAEALFFLLAMNFLNMQLPVFVQATFILLNALSMALALFLWEAMRKMFELLQRLVKAEKLEVVSHLAASISHEVRNPLTVSKGFMQLLYEEQSEQTKKEYLDIAIQELDQAASIINDYLTFAKPATEQQEKINVLQELQYAANIIQPLANMNGVQIHMHAIEKEKCWIQGDRKKFEQCLVNILKNSIEAMPGGGDIQISLRYTQPDIQIKIEDNGTGMTAEQVNRLGEPYFTTKETGTGLGMMVSFSIINGLNGRIKVTSEKRKGTCFFITLPQYEKQLSD